MGIRAKLLAQIQSGDLSVIEHIEIAPRTERRTALSSGLVPKDAVAALERAFGTPPKLWLHQRLAVEHFAEGRSVLVATGTASGKSLIFHLASQRLLGEDRDARVVVFYPLRALTNDQLQPWREALQAIGLDPDAVRLVTGQTLADERKKALQSAQVLLMTPDVCHAWFMRNLAAPEVRRFLRHLRLIVIDEAHVAEGVFGSHLAYLLRRLQAARLIASNSGPPRRLQFLVASATIADAQTHLQALTGVDFAVVDESQDGSPQHGRALCHVAASSTNPQQVLPSIIRALLPDDGPESFISFVDSRQGVERVAVEFADDGVQPYRSGYETHDREEIEKALKQGKLRGVISTSALELGINIPSFSVGMTVGVPPSRKAFRQRIGRVGRSGPGAFVVLAEADAFRMYGSTFDEYLQGSIEPCHLYLQNRFIQYVHARCLHDEIESLGSQARLPRAVLWPQGFEQVFEYARPGSARPREFDAVHQMGGDSPQVNYPLRAAPEANFALMPRDGGPDARIGNIMLPQAIRETYPGAVYLHRAKAYWVAEWRNSAFARQIRIVPSNSPPITRPRIRTFVNYAVTGDAIIDQHFRKSDAGLFAECQMQVTERVEGYTHGGQVKLYKDLRAENPHMTPKTRDFRTSGVVIQIKEPWFTAKGVKISIATAIEEMIKREYSVAPSDISSASTNLSEVNGGQAVRITDGIAVYDSVYGSLRLTEVMFTDFEHILDRFERAAELAPESESVLSSAIVEKLRLWYRSLATTDAPIAAPGQQPQSGLVRIIAPGSIVAVRDSAGVFKDIEIVAPKSVDIGDGPKLVYLYRTSKQSTASPANQMFAADKIELVGDGWSYALWNPESDEILADEAEEDGKS